MDNKCILIVDDDEDFLRVMKFNISKLGYEVLTSFTAEEAKEIISRQLPNLVLLDIMLPAKSGYRFCWEIKNDDKLKTIPVVFISAKGAERDKAMGKSMGADAYLAKPFTMQELEETLKKYL